jgi:hypothetical protein
MLALHLLQNCIVYINALMMQQVLARPHWAELTATDLFLLLPLSVRFFAIRPAALCRMGCNCACSDVKAAAKLDCSRSICSAFSWT